MVFIDRARHGIGGADLVLGEMGRRGIVGGVGAQRVHRVDVGRQGVELALGGVPFGHQFGVAAGGADLQAGGDARLGFLIGASRAGAGIAQFRKAGGIGRNLALQARNLGAQGLDGAVDLGAGIGAAIDGDGGDGGDRGGARNGIERRSRRRRRGSRIDDRSVIRRFIGEHAVDVGTGREAQPASHRKSQNQALFEPVLCWNSSHYALRCPAPPPDEKTGTKTQPLPRARRGRTLGRQS